MVGDYGSVRRVGRGDFAFGGIFHAHQGNCLRRQRHLGLRLHQRLVTGTHPAAQRSTTTGQSRGSNAGSGPSTNNCDRPGSNTCTGGYQGQLRKPERHRRVARGANRHHWRSRLRLRAFQATRLPARQGSGADVRRRTMAGQHAIGSQDARRRMYQGDLFPDRQARHLLSRDPQACRSGRSHHRRAYVVACQPQQQEADRRPAQGRNRERV